MNSKENNINGEVSNEALRLLSPEYTEKLSPEERKEAARVLQEAFKDFYDKIIAPPPPQEDTNMEIKLILSQTIILLHEITVDKELTGEQERMLEDLLKKASSSSYSIKYYDIDDVVEEIESMGLKVSEVDEESPQNAYSNRWELLDEITITY